MANVFNIITMEFRKSVNTPDYNRPSGKQWDDGNWIINPVYVPDCERKYMVVKSDDTIREMTDEEKAVVDYIEPIIPPTEEELGRQRKDNIISEISLTYSISDEIELLRELEQGVLTITDKKITDWFDVVEAAKEKYPESKSK